MSIFTPVDSTGMRRSPISGGELGRAPGWVYQPGGPPKIPPTPPAPATPSGPSDFQTLAQALTAIYGGGLGTSQAPQTVPTAVVPVDAPSSGISLGTFGPVFLLLTLAGVAYFGYHWWKKHHTGGV